MANEIVEVMKNGELALTQNAIESIVYFEKTMKDIKKQYADYREALLNAMKENGIDKIETPEMTVTYIEPDIRFIIDNDRLWKEHSDIAFKCQKESQVKESVRIRMRKQK